MNHSSMVAMPAVKGQRVRPQAPSSSLRIEGGHALRGSISVGGAKNAALPIMAACLLTPEECVINNVPDIEDLRTMAAVLESLGARVEFRGPHQVAVRADGVTSRRTPLELARKMRASFLVMGPLLARFGEAEAPHPGGCAIGVRPVNVDIRGFEAMGAHVRQEDDYYMARAGRLQGTKVYLDYPSHTGTENLLMAACLARAKTVIKHASMEPEVSDLARFLGAMGARISGIGTSVLQVEGVEELHGVEYRVIPDRLAAGTFAIAAAITGGRVTVEDIVPEHLDPVTYKLREAGAQVEEGDWWITTSAADTLNGVDIQAIHYPGFPTDLQAAFGALLTQARGTSVIHERVFENRLLYAGELRRMGAQIEVEGQAARITGPSHLRGCEVTALDIRCGASLVLAALAAEGETVIHQAHHLDRGYEDIAGALSRLGARIWRQSV